MYLSNCQIITANCLFKSPYDVNEFHTLIASGNDTVSHIGLFILEGGGTDHVKVIGCSATRLMVGYTDNHANDHHDKRKNNYPFNKGDALFCSVERRIKIG
jgi:hypothetical protein